LGRARTAAAGAAAAGASPGSAGSGDMRNRATGPGGDRLSVEGGDVDAVAEGL
jgi:hypothetical protein